LSIFSLIGFLLNSTTLFLKNEKSYFHKNCPSASSEVPLAKISLGGSADGQNIESNFATSRVSGDPELVSPQFKAVLNGKNGLLKEVSIDGRVHKVELQFAKYGCKGRGNSQDNSGSYLFAPDKLSVPVFGQESSGNGSIQLIYFFILSKLFTKTMY